MEISPFEAVPTYKCGFCSKRTNSLEKIETHLKVEHGKDLQESNYKILTRDQVVDMLTLNLASTASEGCYLCYYCDYDVIGSIYDIQSHFRY